MLSMYVDCPGLYYYLGILRLLWYNIPMEGQIDLKHMKKAEKKALRLAVVTSLMGGHVSQSCFRHLPYCRINGSGVEEDVEGGQDE